MTNAIAKLVPCYTCGAPAGRACQQLRPDRIRCVPTHSARRKLYERTSADWLVLQSYKRRHKLK